MEQMDDRHLIQVVFSETWWLVLLRGLALVVLGLLFIFWPLATVLILVTFMGAYWFVDGVFTIVQAIRGRQYHSHWGWAIFSGVLGILAGIVIFSRPLFATLLTATFLAYFLGFLALVNGFSAIFTGFRLHKVIDNEWSMILGGILTVLFGLLLIFRPMISVATLVWLAGIFAVVIGVIVIVVAFRMRKIGQEGFAATV